VPLTAALSKMNRLQCAYWDLLLFFFFPPAPLHILSLTLIIRTLQIQLCTSVNRAIAVLSWALQEKKSLECSWIKWCILIDSYLETGLMELSRQNANRLPLLCLLAHTHTSTLCFEQKHSWVSIITQYIFEGYWGVPKLTNENCSTN